MKRKNNKVFYRIILALATTVFLVSGVQLYRMAFRYYEGRESYRKVEEVAGIQESEAQEELRFTPDLEALKEMNPDCVGYIYCEDVLSYPIVRGNDNSYYLTHLFDKTEHMAGAIFMDAGCNGFRDRNCILYGHNMLDGSMFGSLYRFADENFCKEHPIFDVYTEDGHDQYHVLAAYRTAIEGAAYKTSFSQEADFQSFLKEIRGYSSYENVKPNLLDAKAVLTLSTCTWDSSDSERFVVVCVREERSDQIAAH